MKKKAMADKAEPSKKKYIIHKYTVIKFIDDEHGKLFECIPDLWFENDQKSSCYFPPTTGKSYIQRAINCEKPDDTWGIYECAVVKGGFLTYNAGFKMVKEKCSQPYNTSSAEEEQQAANFRRKHPGLFGVNFEHIFAKSQDNVDKSVSHVKTKNSTKLSRGATTFKNAATISSDNNETAEDCARSSKKSLCATAVNETMSGASDIANKTSLPSRGSNSDRSSPSSATSIHSGSIERRPGILEEILNFDFGPKPNRSVKLSHPSSQRRDSRSQSSIRSIRSGSTHRRKSSHSRELSQRRGSRLQSVQRSSRSRSTQKRLRSSSEISRQSKGTEEPIQRRDSRSYSISQSRSSRRSSSGSEILRQHKSQKPNRRRSDNEKSVKTSNQRRGSQSKSISRSSRSSSTQQRSRSRSNQRRDNRSQSIPQSSRSSPQERSRSRSNQRRDRRSHSTQRRSSRSKIVSQSKSRKPKQHLDSRSWSVTQSSRFSRRHSRSPSIRVRRNRSRSSHRRSTQRSQRKIHRSQSASNSKIDHLIKSINELTEAVHHNNSQMTQSDRRLNRLEVTINQIWITLGDMNGHTQVADDEGDDLEGPDLPIVSQNELHMVNRKLKDKAFRQLWLKKEKNFCCPTKTSTDTRTITKYLKRFISLRVRCKFTLKEQCGESGYTLYRDYRRVYEFLIDVMKEGYRMCGKKINREEAHTALRVVWGRSKQLYNGEQRKK